LTHKFDEAIRSNCRGDKNARSNQRGDNGPFGQKTALPSASASLDKSIPLNVSSHWGALCKVVICNSHFGQYWEK
jgi:hypothetical protein